MGSVSFAFEVVEMEPLYGKLFPLSILPTELPQLPVLSAASSISGTDWLLAAFGFNINTRERYAEADGTEVITEVEADPFTSAPPGRSPTAAEQMLRWRSPHRRRSPLRRKPCWVPVSCWNS